MPKTTTAWSIPSLMDERRAARRAARAAIKRRQTAPGRTIRARPKRKTAPVRRATKSKAWLSLSPTAKAALRRAGIKDIPDITPSVKLPKVTIPALPTARGRPAGRARATIKEPSLGFNYAGALSKWNDAEMIPVISSNVGAIGYDEDLSELYIQFRPHDGGTAPVYEYYNVPENVWKRLQTAGSKGKFVWKHIRDVYAYRRARG